MQVQDCRRREQTNAPQVMPFNSATVAGSATAMAQGQRFTDEEIIVEYARHRGGVMPKVEEVRPERTVEPQRTTPPRRDSNRVV